MTKVQAGVVQVLAVEMGVKVLALGVLLGAALVLPLAAIPMCLSFRAFLRSCGTTPLSRISRTFRAWLRDTFTLRG